MTSYLEYAGVRYPFELLENLETADGPMLDWVSHRLHQTHTFSELPVLERVKEIHQPKRVVDIGANLGQHSLFFSEAIGAEVTAFEPIPHFAEIAQKNAPKATIHTTGLASEAGERAAMLGSYMENKAGEVVMANSGGVFLTAGSGIAVAALDSFNLSPDLIKMDVEGMEDQVLGGALETIKAHKPVILAEHRTIEELARCFDILRPLGYHISYQYASGDLVTEYTPNRSA
jgi:methyltransferase, FkbM family